jgi:hypothetical protein
METMTVVSVASPAGYVPRSQTPVLGSIKGRGLSGSGIAIWLRPRDLTAAEHDSVTGALRV